MESIVSFGSWVRRRRKALDLTQAALARQIGCSLVTIQKIEQDERRPSRQIAELLASHLLIPEAGRDQFLRMARGELVAAPNSPLQAIPALPFFQERDEFQAREETLFVARQPELDQLNGYLKLALAGQGRVIFVLGEAGQGKTTLVQEFTRRAQAEQADLVVAAGNCNAYSGVGDPYLPFREILGFLTGEVEARGTTGALNPVQALRLWQLLPATVQVMTSTGPDLLDTFIPAPALARRAKRAALNGAGWLARLEELAAGKAAGQAPGSVNQKDLFEQYAKVMLTLSQQHPLLLVLDDLQWADTGSISLLFHLGRRLAGSRLLVIGIYRPAEVALGRDGERHPLDPVVHELQRHYGDILVDLNQAEGRQFVQALLAAEPNRLGEAFQEALYRHTQGHALFTVETLRGLRERGDLVQDEAGRWLEGANLDWDTLPARVEGVIAERIGRLPLKLQEALKAASVEGEVFTAEVLARVQQVDEREMVRQLSGELDQRHRLVLGEGSQRLEPGGQRLSHYRFRHILFQRYLYQRLDEAERSYLHEAVGNELERLFGERKDTIAVELARHYVQAGQADKAVDYLLLAGDQARRLYAYQEAIDYYEQALALLREGDQTSRERAGRTLMKLGLTYHSAFNFERSRQAYEEGFSLLRQAGEPYRPAVSLPAAPHALRLGWLEPATLDPTLVSDEISLSVISQLFSGLAANSPELDVVPDIAQGWEVLDGGRTYLFHLRDEVRWSDGAKVTAADFEYAWKRALDPALQSPSASMLFDVKGARAFYQGELADPGQVGVRALDDLTLLVELAGPTAYFPHLLTMPPTFPIPRHIVTAHGQAWAEPENIVTNGPFLLEARQPGQALSLRRNPAYHGQFWGNLQRVELYDMTAQLSWLEMYGQNKLDVLQLLLMPLDQLAQIRQQYAEEYVTGPWLQTFYVLFNLSRPPFNDVRVRRAFTLAIDRNRLANIVRQGYECPATGGLVPPGLPGHSDDIGLPYDPLQAQRLLAEAGYPGGRGFPIVRALVAEGEAFITGGDWLQAEWQKILGVQIRWERVKMSGGLDRVDSEIPWLALYGWVADYPDPDSFLHVCMQQDMIAGWQNEAFTRLVAAARQSLDQQERLKLYQAADKILIEEAALLPLLYGRLHLLVKPWLSQFSLSPLSWWYWKDVIIKPHQD